MRLRFCLGSGCALSKPLTSAGVLRPTPVPTAPQPLRTHGPARRGHERPLARPPASPLPREAAAEALVRDGGSAFWFKFGQFCKRHRYKIILASVGVALVFTIFAMQIQLSVDQATLSPRGSVALRTLRELPLLGLSAGLLSPVEIFVDVKRKKKKKNAIAVATAATAAATAIGENPKDWRCKDDSYDLHFALLTTNQSDSPIGALDPAFYTCDDLNALGPFLCNSSYDPAAYRKDTETLARAFCPATCRDSYCPGRHHQRATVLDDRMRTLLLRLRASILERVEIPARNVKGIFWSPTNTSELISAEHALDQVARGKTTWFTAQFYRLANFDASSCRIEIALPDGFGTNNATQHVEQLRQVVSAFNDRSESEEEERDGDFEYEFYIVSDTLVVLDIVASVLAATPRMMAIVTGAVVCVIAGLAFRSVLLPLRLLVTVVVTLAIVSGILHLVVRHAMQLDGVYWLVVIACGPLVIGLTIDFDVFLISKIYDARKAGLSTEQAILHGISTQSRIITIAGSIMASAFASLLLSASPVLNQIGVVLVVASLVDTFFTRAFLCPALLFSAERYNWWPGKMPEVEEATVQYDGAVRTVRRI